MIPDQRKWRSGAHFIHGLPVVMGI
jgi:hypothetical protein